jgi:ribose 5-phosphate isomerase B
MIYLGADKHGYKAISYVADFLRSKDIAYTYLGVKSDTEDLSLQNLIPRVVNEVKKDKQNLAILSCGTGIGIEIGANRFAGIRASLVTNEKLARWSRIYDNTNVLCLTGWDADKDNINQIVDTWLTTEYDGSESRLEMLRVFDEWH